MRCIAEDVVGIALARIRTMISQQIILAGKLGCGFPPESHILNSLEEEFLCPSVIIFLLGSNVSRQKAKEISSSLDRLHSQLWF